MVTIEGYNKVGEFAGLEVWVSPKEEYLKLIKNNVVVAFYGIIESENTGQQDNRALAASGNYSDIDFVSVGKNLDDPNFKAYSVQFYE